MNIRVSLMGAAVGMVIVLAIVFATGQLVRAKHRVKHAEAIDCVIRQLGGTNAAQITYIIERHHVYSNELGDFLTPEEKEKIRKR